MNIPIKLVDVILGEKVLPGTTFSLDLLTEVLQGAKVVAVDEEQGTIDLEVVGPDDELYVIEGMPMGLMQKIVVQ